MATRKLLLSTTLAVSTALGCGAEPTPDRPAAPAAARAEDGVALSPEDTPAEKVNTASPTSGVAFGGAIPALTGASRTFPTTSTEPGRVSGAVDHGWSSGTDPSAAVTAPGADATRLSWRSAAIAATVPAALQDRLKRALPCVTSGGTCTELRDKTTLGAFEGIVAELGKFPGYFTDHGTELSDAFTGYNPVRGRWLKQQYVWPASGDTSHGMGLQSYPDPSDLDDVRLRGARLYCAAREAQVAQGSTVRTMGEQTALSLNVLGAQLDFLVVEPTVTLDGPQRFIAPAGVTTSPDDGAQAFQVPLLVGAKVTPIRGIGLPSLGEIRAPAVLTTADAEVVTPSERRWIDQGYGTGKYDYAKRHQTVSHLDAITTAARSRTLDGRVLIGTLFGVIQVYGTTTLTVSTGKPEQVDERVLKSDGYWIGAAPGTPRSGMLRWLGNFGFHDGAWTGPGSCDHVEIGSPCPSWFWQVLEAGTSAFPFQLPRNEGTGMTTRAWQDDDHAVDLQTQLQAKLGLLATIETPKIGPFNVSPEVTGNIVGNLEIRHEVRDHLDAEEQRGVAPLYLPTVTPTSAVTVRPRTVRTASIDPLKVQVHFTMTLPWPIGDISWDPTFLNLPSITIDRYDSKGTNDWTERSALRLGTGSALGQRVGTTRLPAMQQPSVRSHLPGVDAPPVAMTQTVGACLADPKPNPTTPGPCAGEPTVSREMTVQMCLTQPVQVSNACANVPAAVASLGLSGDRASCMARYLTYLCTGAHRQEGSSLNHVIAMDATDLTQLGQVMDACIHANVALETEPRDPLSAAIEKNKAPVEAFIESFFKQRPCDATGHLLPESAVWGAVGGSDKKPSAPGAPGTCH